MLESPLLVCCSMLIEQTAELTHTHRHTRRQCEAEWQMCDSQTFTHEGQLTMLVWGKKHSWALGNKSTPPFFSDFLLRHTHYTYSEHMFLALAVTSPALWSKSSSSIRLRAASPLLHSVLLWPPTHTHTLGGEKTRLVEEEKKRVGDEGLSPWLRMALLWQPGSCGPHRSTAASRLSLLLLFFYKFSVSSSYHLTYIHFLKVSLFPSLLPPFLTSFLYLTV